MGRILGIAAVWVLGLGAAYGATPWDRAIGKPGAFFVHHWGAPTSNLTLGGQQLLTWHFEEAPSPTYGVGTIQGNTASATTTTSKPAQCDVTVTVDKDGTVTGITIGRAYGLYCPAPAIYVY